MKGCSLAIFISTSRNTEDVFMKLFDFNLIHLNKIGVKIFVGCNNSTKTLQRFLIDRRIELIDAMAESNWNDEVDSQVQMLKSIYNINYLLFLLDDFLIEKFNYSDLVMILTEFTKGKLDYIRLKERIYLYSLIASLFKKGKLYRINSNAYYYNSLQISLWKVDSFLLCTKANKGRSIWEFEWLVLNENWSVYSSVFEYDHIIEKGNVRQSKFKLLRKFGIRFDGNRGVYNDVQLISKIKSIKFFILGYLFSKRP